MNTSEITLVLQIEERIAKLKEMMRRQSSVKGESTKQPWKVKTIVVDSIGTQALRIVDGRGLEICSIRDPAREIHAIEPSSNAVSNAAIIVAAWNMREALRKVEAWMRSYGDDWSDTGRSALAAVRSALELAGDGAR